MKIQLLAALVAAAVASTAVSAESLKIGVDGGYKPYSFTEADGTLVGFDVDLANAMCEVMNTECEIMVVPWDALIPSLNSERIDAIIAGMNNTEKRRQAISFSSPYVLDPRIFVTTESGNDFDAGIAALDLDADFTEHAAAIAEALDGATVGVLTQTSSEAMLQQVFGESVSIKSYKEQEPLDLDLEAGRVDYMVVLKSYLPPAVKAGKPFKRVGPTVSGGPLGSGASVGVRKDDEELRQNLSDAIATLAKSGELKSMSEKWFDQDLTPAN